VIITKLKTNTLHELRQSVKKGFIIHTLIFLCVLQFTLQNFTQLDAVRPLLFPSNLSSLFETHQYWRLITPVFIHFTFSHLISNLFLFWYFARVINTYSPIVFVSLIFVAALVGDLGEFLLVDEKFGGISGIDFALFGFIFCYQKIRPEGELSIDPLVSSVVILFLLLTATDWFGQYAFYAHLTGLIVGLIFGFIFAKKDKHLQEKTSPFKKGE